MYIGRLPQKLPPPSLVDSLPISMEDDDILFEERT